MHAFVTHNCLLFTVNVLLNLSIDTNLFLEKLSMTGQKKVPYSVLPTMTRFCNRWIIQNKTVNRPFHSGIIGNLAITSQCGWK